MEYWKAPKEIQEMVQALIVQHHPDLAVVASETIVVFREKASKSGGQVVLGSSKKVTPLVNALANEKFQFALEIAADVWEHDLSAKQKEALLDHLLCACRCEEDPESGGLKCSVARPDIMVFRDNIDRYGMWLPKDQNPGEPPSPVDGLFGTSS